MIRIKTSTSNRKSPFVKLHIFAPVLFLLFGAFGATVAAQTDAAANKAELVQKAGKYGNLARAQAFDKFVTLQLSAACWEKHLSQDSAPNGVDHANRWGLAIANYAKTVGYGDLEATVTGVKVNQERADAVLKQLDGKFSYTIQADKATCSAESWKLLAAYSGAIRDFISDRYSDLGLATGWRPTGGKMLVTLIVAPTAKDVTVTTDGANFTVTAPSSVEPTDWNGKIKRGLAKGGAK